MTKTGKRLMRPIKRAINIDFHTMPGIYNFNEQWNAEEFARILKNAGVCYINAFARCNEGFSYYPTEVGTMYPGLKRDMFGELLEACHKVDIGVSAYINAGYHQEMGRKHREWLVVNKELAAQNEKDGIADYFLDMCYYHSGWREYLVREIKEITKLYDIDGLFVDCMSLNGCLCSSCVDHMVKLGRNPLNSDEVFKTAKEGQLDFCREVKRIIGDEKYLFFNGVPYGRVQQLNTHIEIEGLPGGQGYDYFQAQAAYARGLSDRVIYMTARFQKSWADFGGFKTKASMEYDAWDALSNAMEISVGDHMHPAENLERHVYRMIGEIYQWAEACEPWTEGAKYLAEIGVITQSEGLMGATHRGVARMLGELKYGYNIINENMDFSPYRLLILPDDILITPVLQKKLKEHLAEGKGIISSGMSGMSEDKSSFAMPEWKIKFDGIDASNASYFKMLDTTDEIMADMRWSMYSHGILMRADSDAEVIAEYIRPYFNRHFDGVRGYWYTPPEKADGHAAAVRCGNIYHICFQIFEAYYTSAMLAHKLLVKRGIEALLTNPLIKTESIPSTARVTLTEKEKTLQVHVKITYPEVRGEADIIEEHQSLPAGAAVLVRGKYDSACIVPSGERISVAYQNGYTKLFLPQIDGYAMIALDK